MEIGLETWGCSAWREGCMETTEHLPVSEGATRKLKRDITSETGVTGQDGMASH